MKKQTIRYPEKTSINLVIKEKSTWRPGKVLPLMVLVLLLGLAFGKFAVADRLEKLRQEQDALSELQRITATLEDSTADYDSVLAEYSKYSSGWMSEEEAAAVGREIMLDIVEQELMPRATVKSVMISGNSLGVELADITLEETSFIVSRLDSYDSVLNVAVYTANSQVQQGDVAAVSMIITLQKVGGGQA